MFPLSIVFLFILILPTTTCFQSSLFPLTTTSQSHTIISSSITTTYSSQSSLLRNITPIRGMSSPSDKSTTATTTTTSLNLFFDQTKEQSGKDDDDDDDDTVILKQQQQQKKTDFLSSYKQKYKIPQEIYNDVSNINSQKLPYEIKLSRGGADNNNNEEKETILLIRHLEMDDLPTVVRMCVKEFGSYTPSTDNNEGSFDLMTSLQQQEQQRKDKTPEFIKEALQTYENFVFAFIVQLGLDQRIQRRIQGENVVPDHNVLCITKKTTQGEEEEIIGISEVSLQPLNPNRTAPPFVLPFRIKKLLTSNIFSQSKQKLVPYVSNVMVKDTCRGLGYGKLLMYASEGIAKEFYSSSLNKGGAKGDIFLHVDANLSGKAAQNLYWGMGYEGFIENEYYNGNDQKNYDERNNKDENPFAWMYEPSSSTTYVNRGLYLVDGVPLLYMKKTLDLMNDDVAEEEREEGELE